MRFVRFESTPNPNAVKCLTEPGPSPEPIRSYFNAAQADEAGDPLARALFAIPGVTNVLIHTEFVTLCKAPDAKWPRIRSGAKHAIESYTQANAADG